MRFLDAFIQQFQADSDNKRELVGIAHVAVFALSAYGFEHWSHWWAALSVAVVLNSIRLIEARIRTDMRNERETDEFIRRHYRL